MPSCGLLPHFDDLRPLFADQLRVLEQLDRNTTAWEAAHGRIRQLVSLERSGGHAVPEFLLHVDGDDAWWRWSDKPFPAQR